MAPKGKIHNSVYLIERETNQILSIELPYNKKVMQVLYYNMRYIKMSLDKSVHLVLSATIILWQKARIPLKNLNTALLNLKPYIMNTECLKKILKKVRNSGVKRTKI